MSSHAQHAVEVLVMGEALMDIVRDHTGTNEHPGGSPANVALGLGRRGVDVAFLTDLGRDRRGSHIVRHLERSQVQVLRESFSSRRTSTATASLGPDGSASYRFDVQWRLSPALLTMTATIVHTGSIAAFLEPGRTALVAHLDRFSPRMITFDPNIRPALLGTHAEALGHFHEIAARSDVVKMSDEDAAWLFPRLSFHELGPAVAHLGPRLVVVTHGAAGSVLTTTTDEVHVPAASAPVSDTIGAGDTYMASLIRDLLHLGDRPLDAGTVADWGARAARAAAITVARPGADLPWQDELDGHDGRRNSTSN